MSTGLDTDALPEYQLARRAAIMRAATELLEERDFDQVQVRDVAMRANVALGTLYRYFQSKEHLYAAVLGEWMHGVRLTQDISGLPPADRLRARVRFAMRSLAANPGFFRIVVLLKSTTDEVAINESIDLGASLNAALRHELEALPAEEARQVTQALWSVLTDQLGQVQQGRQTIEAADAVMDTFLDLVAARLLTID